MKVSILGLGHVGNTLAYTLVTQGLVDELVLVSRNLEKAEGEALDLLHAEGLIDSQVQVRAGAIEDTAGSDILVLTFSVPLDPSFSSRLEFGSGNRVLFEALLPALAEKSPEALLLVVTNPVDVMTYHAIEMSGFPDQRVFGTGTLIDSARFRTLLSREQGIHPDDVRAYILGEHGDAQFPLFSGAMAGGLSIADTPRARELFEAASQAGYEVVKRKGYTSYAIAQAAAMAIETIGSNALRTMPLSVRIRGYLGVQDVCLSLPVVLGRNGVERVLYPELNEEERQAFLRGAEQVREGIRISENPPAAG